MLLAIRCNCVRKYSRHLTLYTLHSREWRDGNGTDLFHEIHFVIGSRLHLRTCCGKLCVVGFNETRCGLHFSFLALKVESSTAKNDSQNHHLSLLGTFLGRKKLFSWHAISSSLFPIYTIRNLLFKCQKGRRKRSFFRIFEFIIHACNL